MKVARFSLLLVISVCLFCSDAVCERDERIRNRSSVQKDKSNATLVEARKQNNIFFDLRSLIWRILPMLASPFIMQITTSVPLNLLWMKFSLMKANFLGILAIVFLVVNLMRNKIQDKQGQFYSHNVNLHYGH